MVGANKNQPKSSRMVVVVAATAAAMTAATAAAITAATAAAETDVSRLERYCTSVLLACLTKVIC
jgi:hypothetical protein